LEHLVVAGIIKMSVPVFCSLIQCKLLVGYQGFGGMCCPYFEATKLPCKKYQKNKIDKMRGNGEWSRGRMRGGIKRVKK